MTKKTRRFTIDAMLEGQRFDSAAAQLFNEYSRSRLQSWIKSGHLTLNGACVNQRQMVHNGDLIELEIVETAVLEDEPCAMALDIVFEDEAVLVLNKPVDLVVHPGAGNRRATLLNGLLHYLPQLKALPRAGIVHRLDKDTSGLMVVAKTLRAHTSLVKQLQARSVSREYWALVQGVMTAGGAVEAAIGRHPKQRTKMAVLQQSSTAKSAVTHYRVIERFTAHTLVRCLLETGRTHQIRVHMAHLHYPLVGDKTYGGRLRLPAGSSPQLKAQLQNFSRQALHAKRLAFAHPHSGEEQAWEIPLPDDFQGLLDTLRSEH